MPLNPSQDLSILRDVWGGVRRCWLGMGKGRVGKEGQQMYGEGKKVWGGEGDEGGERSEKV